MTGTKKDSSALLESWKHLLTNIFLHYHPSYLLTFHLQTSLFIISPFNMSLKSIKEALPSLISSIPLYPSSKSTSSSSSSSLSNATISSAIQRISAHPLIPTISLFLATLTIHTLSVKKMNLVSKIYDSVIVNMTEKWYHCVLNKLDDNCVVLDVGIGTAGK